MTENPLNALLRSYRIILGSGSPRRQQFLQDIGVEFELRLKPVHENYPPQLKAEEIPIYLAKHKAEAFKDQLENKELLITSDTIVWHKKNCLGKPGNAEEAFHMLQRLSGDRHQVFTAVCFTTKDQQRTIHAETTVRFRDLKASEIQYYIDTYSPFDKAGGYGIQDWIGLIGIEEIHGSYFNVMGLPTHLVYKTLTDMVF